MEPKSERKPKNALREALASPGLPANGSGHGCDVSTTGAQHQQPFIAMTTLNSRLQLALLNRKKGRNLLEKGFTLVELMIVIVIVGILSAVALPNFLGTRAKAEAQALIGSMASQAKLCGANMIVGDPIALPAVAGVVVSAACAGTADVNITNTPVFSNPTKIGGVRCGTATANGIGNNLCTLTVNSVTGSVTGAWSGG